MPRPPLPAPRPRPGPAASLPLLAPLLLAALAAPPALAQLTPDRTYYGIGRPIPMTVHLPPEIKGEAIIQLLAPVSADVKATASVVAGRVDMGTLFPILWQPAIPVTQERVYYAQLSVAGQKVGPAVVLQPMIDPPYCVIIEPTNGEPRWRDSRGAYSGIRAYTDRHIVMETTLGDIEFALRPDQAPNTVYAFMDLCAGGFYTDIIFHRIKALSATGSPFVIQAGDPIQGHTPEGGGAGEGGPGFMINLEKSRLPHDFGVLSMARTPQPNSAGSQFFICLSREGTSFLDGAYTSFAQAVGGADTIQKIAAVDVDEHDRPRNPPVLKSCRLVDAPPYGEGPPTLKAPPAAPIKR